jgi:hypothetical protein
MVACSTIRVKSPSPASTIQGRNAWQFPHRGLPRAAAGTRFICPQFWHLIVRVAVVGGIVASRRGISRGLIVGDGELVALEVDSDGGAVGDGVGEQGAADAGLDFAGDVSA